MQNITPAQADVLNQLRGSGLARHTWANDLGVASFARGEFGSMGSAPHVGIQAFLQEFGLPFGPLDILEAMRLVRTRTDSLGWRHLEYQQTYAPTDASGSPAEAQRRWMSPGLS